MQLPTVVTAGDLALNQESVTILDVRSPAEYESEHIPGSFNVPLDQLPTYADSLRNTIHKPVVLVCRSGMRAQQAESALRANDLQGLHILEGGISSWESANRPLIRGVQKWDMNRQVRGVAGALVMVFSLLGLFVATPFTFGALAVGGGLLFSAVTNTCGMAKMLGMLPYNKNVTCNVRQVISDIAATQEVKTQGAD
jgi:rhodanese-related sulfurtransferase